MKAKAVMATLLGVIVLAGMVSSVKEPELTRKDAGLQPGPHAIPIAAGTRDQVLATYNKLPLRFEPNQGQTDPQVRFLSQGPSYRLFLDRRGEAVLALHGPLATKSSQDLLASRRASTSRRARASAPAVAEDVVRLNLVGANSTPKSVGVDQLPAKSNYFIGNDPAKWHTNVPTFAQVRYEGIYPGVDLVYYGNQGQLEYDFVVSPGADPSAIRFGIHGARSVRIDDQGNLVLKTRGGSVRLIKPVAYQVAQESAEPGEVNSKRLVAANFVVDRGSEVRFRLSAYDSSKPLIIDPVALAYASYLGGSGTEMAAGVATDGSGGAYVAGLTLSANFPLSGAPDTSCVTPSDSSCPIFVAKFDTTTSGAGSLKYVTFLGGSKEQDFMIGATATPSVSNNAIAADSAGNAYVTGNTNSTDFPVMNGFQASCKLSAVTGNCNGNAIVAKLGPTGSVLYSTYLGGSGGEQGNGIAVDGKGLIYVTGETVSTDFPFTAGTIGQTCVFPKVIDTCDDAYVAKIDPTMIGGSSLVYATYLGFSEAAPTGGGGEAIAADSAGNAYITGATDAANSFNIVNGFQSNLGGEFDAYLVKLDPQAAKILYSTLLGGNDDDLGKGVAVDNSGTAYITGSTLSSNFPTKNGLPAPSDAATKGENAFVARIDTNPPGGKASLIYSTYLGGGTTDFGTSIAIPSAPSGIVFVTGTTMSVDFPKMNPLPPHNDMLQGLSDAFVTELDTNIAGSAGLLFSTFLGGSSTDSGIGIAVDSSGNAYVSGDTESSDFPVSGSAFQSKLNGTGTGAGTIADAFIAKLNFPALLEPEVTFSPSASVDFGSQLVNTKSATSNVTLTNTGTAPLMISGIAPSGDFAETNNCPASLSPAPAANDSCVIMATFTPTTTGHRVGAVTVTDNASNVPGNQQTVSLTGIGTDFDLESQAGSSTSVTVTAGNSGTYNLVAESLDGFVGTVALSADCSNVPKETSCAVSSNSVNVNGSNVNFTFTVGTTSNALSPFLQNPRVKFPGNPLARVVLYLLLGLLFLLVVLEARRKAGAHRRWNLLAPSAALIFVLLIGGCGGGSSSGSGSGGSKGTAPGTYKITITGSSQGVKHLLDLSLTVQ